MRAHRHLRQTIFVFLIASVTSAGAAELLAEMLTYVKASAGLISQLTSDLNNTKFSSLPREKREDAKNQLQRLSDSLSQIFMSQSTLVQNLEFYVRIANNSSKPAADREPFWNDMIARKARDVSQAVTNAIDFVQNDKSFKVALSNEDLRKLRDTLGARGTLLMNFQQMSPPASKSEILQLEALISGYKVLIDNLFKLRVAVDGALRGLEGT